jgi:hypothetical protein
LAREKVIIHLSRKNRELIKDIKKIRDKSKLNSKSKVLFTKRLNSLKMKKTIVMMIKKREKKI